MHALHKDRNRRDMDGFSANYHHAQFMPGDHLEVLLLSHESSNVMHKFPSALPWSSGFPTGDYYTVTQANLSGQAPLHHLTVDLRDFWQ
jgi:hypothetical protein